MLQHPPTALSTKSATPTHKALEEKITQTLAKLENVRKAIATVIFGQDLVVTQVLCTLLSGGHGLLVGVPGLAKTRLVETLGIVLGLDAVRIQFTPDLMPSDILGSEVLEEDANHARSFRFLKGPIFAELLMADEINRASPRTQSALLQAMQEHHVTIAGKRYDLPDPFHVLATQNPLEQEGAYPLPEAQLDRFLMQIDVTYPDRLAERQMMLETTGETSAQIAPVMSRQDLKEAQALVRMMPLGEPLVEAILTLVRTLRPQLAGQMRTNEDNTKLGSHISWGPGPRATQALSLVLRAHALLDGRLSPSLDDLHAFAIPVLQHRMALTYQAQAEGLSVTGLIKQALQTIEG